MHAKAHTSDLVIHNVSSGHQGLPKYPRFPSFGAGEKFRCGVVGGANKRSNTFLYILCRELD